MTTFALIALVLAASTAAPQGDVAAACAAGWPGGASCTAEVARFQAAWPRTPVWSAGGRPTPQALAVAALLDDAGAKGLRPEDYGAPGWTAALASLAASPRAPGALDLALTVAALRYLSDLEVGRVAPRDARWAMDPPRDEAGPADALAQAAAAADVDAVVDAVEPPYGGYRRARAALRALRAAAARGDAPALAVPARSVKPGERLPWREGLLDRLAELGDLPAASRPPAAEIYDAPVVEAVRRFQRRHGLDDDGVLGARTVEALNVPLERRAAQLALALERWRWVPHRLGAAVLAVNIPEFRLRASDPATGRRVEMKVVVGRAYRTQTPVFAAEMRHLVFRPAWTVPAKIQREELVPALAKDAEYLARGDYELLDRRGEVVSATGHASPEQLALLRRGALQIRQRPGPKNALGGVKFVFANPYDVYLHGTPARRLFERSRRDFSHGCIRVEDPLALAEWALQGDPAWTPARIREAAAGSRTVEVRLPRPVRVLVVYGTALVGEDGVTRFLGDLYGLDGALERLLADRPVAARPAVPAG